MKKLFSVEEARDMYGLRLQMLGKGIRVDLHMRIYECLYMQPEYDDRINNFFGNENTLF